MAKKLKEQIDYGNTPERMDPNLERKLASPAPAPTTKPAPTKPGTKPGKRPNPFKNPNPGENPAPKAKKVSPEDAKEKVIDVIMQLLEK